MGQLILDHVTAMMEQGGGGGSIGSTGGAASAPTPSVSMPAATVAAAVAPTVASSRPSTSSGGGEDNMLDGHSLVRYVFSPELPFDAQLRIRGAPSGDGEILGTVNPDDVIWGSPSVTSGSYLRVKVDGRTHEAWMQTSGGGQQFLVTENERAAMQGSGGGGGGGDMAMAAPPATAPASMPSYQAEIGGPQMSISTPGHGMMARPVTAPVMGGGMGMNQSVMMSPARSMPQMFSSMGQGTNERCHLLIFLFLKLEGTGWSALPPPPSLHDGRGRRTAYPCPPSRGAALCHPIYADNGAAIPMTSYNTSKV